MAATIEIHFTKLFINNEWLESKSGGTFSVLDPTTGKVLSLVQNGDLRDLDLAVSAARKSISVGGVWRTMNASDRGRLLHTLSELVERDLEYLAMLDTRNAGLPIVNSRRHVGLAVKSLRYYAGLCDKVQGQTFPADGNFLCFSRKEPVGVCALILSWNVPFLMAGNKLAMALCAGNALVIKPAQQTPLSTLYLAHLVQEAGFPPGVVNVITGNGGSVGEAIAGHPNIDLLAFVGSTEVGLKVLESAARSNCKRTLMSLAGKSPVVVFPDADFDRAVRVCHRAVFTNQGQICCAGSRTYVHEDIYDRFVVSSRQMAQQVVLGDPALDTTKQGPQIDAKVVDYVMSMIQSGIEEGAKLECGGSRGPSPNFVQPTVFSEVQDHMRIAREEIFGPVQQILKFRNLEEVIERANDSKYGLAAAVFTSDMQTAITFAQNVQAGAVWANTYLVMNPQTPFGGFKMSGNGRECGVESLEDFLKTKTITINLAQK